ncbi:hypothetical protein [Belnapia moabensis]|uniref:hypothetical protein n=1 Tax=Belnapia moabensis TaxID=365533 RepID=UPI0005BC378B|nr:hypothetical protein [Belnapia moabensis]
MSMDLVWDRAEPATAPLASDPERLSASADEAARTERMVLLTVGTIAGLELALAVWAIAF